MSKLIKVTPQQKDDHVIYICDETKQPYFNLAQALIIFPNVSKTTLFRRLEGVSNSDVKIAEIPTNGGLQVVPLFPAPVLLDLAFEFDLPLAKLMGQAGATVYLYGIAGYKVQVVEEPKPSARVLPEKLEVATELRLLNESTLPASVKQLLIDSLVNEYIDTTPKLTANTERWVGVVQKAEELNYHTNHSSRTKLGNYASKQCHRLIRQREKRLCNGEFRPIWTYLDNAALGIVIAEFFS
jgi:hypothetical protein